MKRTRVALIGAGNISDKYLTYLHRYPEIEVVGIAARSPENAGLKARKHGIPRAGTTDMILSDPSVELVLNLTIPAAHAEVTSAALRAGKHVWSEKPLALDRDSGKELLRLASEQGLRLGCAPDTVLCPGVQQSLATLAEVVAESGEPAHRARMLLQHHGPDSWHPNPEFLFKAGAGPLMDYGPYYLTFAVLALGPIKRVIGSVGVTPRTTREVGQGELAGSKFGVDVPTTVVALLEHEGGAVTDIALSFDAHSRRAEVEFQTPSASVIATDPDKYGGTVRVMVRAEEIATKVTDDPAWGRGVGCVDMVRAIAAGDDHRASGQLAYHVLDVMLSIEEAIATEQPMTIASSAPRVPLIPEGWHPERPS